MITHEESQLLALIESHPKFKRITAQDPDTLGALEKIKIVAQSKHSKLTLFEHSELSRSHKKSVFGEGF